MKRGSGDDRDGMPSVAAPAPFHRSATGPTATGGIPQSGAAGPAGRHLATIFQGLTALVRAGTDQGGIRTFLTERFGLAATDAEITAGLAVKDPAQTLMRLAVTSRDRAAGISWGANDHTTAPVSVFAEGPGAERFAEEQDNARVGATLMMLATVP